MEIFVIEGNLNPGLKELPHVNTRNVNPPNSAGKESACNEGDLGSIPGLGRSPEEGKCDPLQDSCLQNSTECIVHRVGRVRHDEQLLLSLSYKEIGILGKSKQKNGVIRSMTANNKMIKSGVLKKFFYINRNNKVYKI